MNKKILSVIMIIILIMTVFNISALAAGPQEKIRVIIGLKNNSQNSIEKQVKSLHGDLRYSFNELDVISADIPEAALEGIKKNPNVLYIREAVQVQKTADTLTWGVDKINAEHVWGSGENSTNVLADANAGSGVKVAVIDTGIDYNHEDLSANVKGGISYVDYTNDYMDDDGHGTHVAGVIGALDNNLGVIGVAPQVDLYAVKVLDYNGSGYEDDVANGIIWSQNNAIDIVSMSLGADVHMPLVESAVNSAYSNGVLIIAAAGNDGFKRPTYDTVDYPGRYDSVVAVAATTQNNKRAVWGAWSSSSTGWDVEVSAPGDQILSTYYDNRYATMSGTSMATPMVSGVAALVLNANPDFSPTEVRERLQETAIDIGSTGVDVEFGYGLVDAINASLSSSEPPEANEAPTSVITSPVNGATVSGNTLIAATAHDDNSVSKVDFFIDGVLLDTDFTSPYTVTMDTNLYDNGAHSIKTTAYDSLNQTGSDSISITINNISEPPPEGLNVTLTDATTFYKAGTKFVGAQATINVKDAMDQAVGDISIVYEWTGSVTSSGSGLSDSNGQLHVKSRHIKNTNAIESFTLKIISINGEPPTTETKIVITSSN